MHRHLIAAAITLFFLAMMVLLVKNEILPTLNTGDGIPVSTRQLADEWTGKDEWAALSVNGRPVGALRTVAQRDGTGYHAFLKLVLEGGPVSGKIETAALLNERLELEQLHVTATVPGAETAALELAGLVEHQTLRLRLSSATGVKYQQVDLPRPITMNFAADPFMSGSQMVPGETYALDVYDPVWGMQAGRMKLTLAGTQRATLNGVPFDARIVEAEMGTATTKIWLDQRGDPFRREIRVPLGGGSTSRNEKGAEVPQIVVRLDRIDSPEEMVKYAELRNLPDPPAFQPEDLRGEDSGEPLQALGILPMLVKGSFGNLNK